MKIMFVDVGNTCRSIMAEALFNHIFDGNIEVFSSGTMAQNGDPPSENSIKVCKDYGIDIPKHKAIYFKDSDIEEMDLVLTFEWFHKKEILTYYPNLEVYTIKEYIGEYPLDIDDPYCGDYNIYEACFCEIYRTLKKVKLIHFMK